MQKEAKNQGNAIYFDRFTIRAGPKPELGHFIPSDSWFWLPVAHRNGAQNK